MDPVSYSKASQQEQRIKKIVADPDSVAGLVSVPNLVPTGETITIPVGRTVVHPNLQVDGTLVVDGTLFIPSGGTYTADELDVTVVKQNGNVVANDSAVVHKTGNETIDGIKTFTSLPITPSSAPTTDYQVANKKYVDEHGAVIATIAEVQTGTDNAKAISPLALMGALANSKTTNGYCKLPNGVIFQWGFLPGGTTTSRSATFPIAFPTACLNVQLSLTKADATPYGNLAVMPFTASTIKFSCYTLASVEYYWMAIGY